MVFLRLEGKNGVAILVECNAGSRDASGIPSCHESAMPVQFSISTTITVPSFNMFAVARVEVDADTIGMTRFF